MFRSIFILKILFYINLEYQFFSVYFSWPNENGPPSWHLLGNITNNKPSAIFKISGLKKNAGGEPNNVFTTQTASLAAQIGISVSFLI